MSDDPSDVENDAGGGDQALGFSEDDGSPKKEKYNTRFIVANMSKDTKKTQMILVGIVGAALLGGLTWFLLHEEAPPPKPAAAAAPAEGAAAVPAGEPKPAEAKPAEAKPAEGAPKPPEGGH